MTRNALIIFVKNLIDGKVKTRLAATMGNVAAMDIYRQLLEKTHQTVKMFETDKIVFYSDFIADDTWEKTFFKKQLQVGDSLGKRMENAFKSFFAEGYQKLIIIGTDCPGINETILDKAFAELEEHDLAIGPAIDGGYYLLGMKRELSYLFQNISWSTDMVLEQTISLCKKNQLTYFLLPVLSDIDVEKDLPHFKDLVMVNKKNL